MLYKKVKNITWYTWKCKCKIRTAGKGVKGMYKEDEIMAELYGGLIIIKISTVRGGEKKEDDEKEPPILKTAVKQAIKDMENENQQK